MSCSAVSPSPQHEAPLQRFLVLATTMLEAATPESTRCRLERELVALLPTLRALGVFELLTPRQPALRALIADELAALDGAPEGILLS